MLGYKRPDPQQRAAERAERIARQGLGTLKPLHRGTYGGAVTVPDPKAEPVRDEEYRRLVAALPCKACGILGYSQAAHPNTGKGMGSKTDDTACFPLCGPRPGEQGCHARFDQGAMFDKATRRVVEEAWAEDTRRAIAAQKGLL